MHVCCHCDVLYKHWLRLEILVLLKDCIGYNKEEFVTLSKGYYTLHINDCETWENGPACSTMEVRFSFFIGMIGLQIVPITETVKRHHWCITVYHVMNGLTCMVHTINSVYNPGYWYAYTLPVCLFLEIYLTTAWRPATMGKRGHHV